MLPKNEKGFKNFRVFSRIYPGYFSKIKAPWVITCEIKSHLFIQNENLKKYFFFDFYFPRNINLNIFIKSNFLTDLWTNLGFFPNQFQKGQAIWTLWQYQLWSFQGKDTKLERFLAKNQFLKPFITKMMPNFWQLAITPILKIW